MEKYLGDITHEKECDESITATIKERMRKLTSKCEEIIQIATELKKWGAWQYYIVIYSYGGILTKWHNKIL